MIRHWKRLAVVLVLAGWPLGAVAQEAAPATEPTTEPATAMTAAPATEPTTEPVVEAAAPATRPVTWISLNFKDASVDAVLEYLSDQAGFVVVKDQPVTGRVTMLSKQPVTPEEAVALLDTALRIDGFTAIQMGRTLKVTSLSKAKKQNIPVHFGADPSQITPSDQLITQIIPLRSVDAVRLQKDLQPLINPDADLTSNPGSNTLMITDTAANIRRVVEIVADLDSKDSMESGIRVRQLKYADAASTAKMITDIFGTPANQQQQGGQPQLQQFFRTMAAGGGFGGGPGGGAAARAAAAAAAGPEEAGHVARVQASYDLRTNTIVVTGPADTLHVIDSVLDQLDANPAQEQTFFIYHVKNGQAVDMQNTLNSIFAVNGAGVTNTSNNTQRSLYNGSTTGNRTGVGGSTSGGLGGSLGASGGSFATNSTPINRSTPSGSANTAANRGATGAAGSVAAGVSDLIGQVFVVADQDTNSLLVATTAKYEQRIKDVILELDRPVAQVLIKVLIAEVTHDNTLDEGLDFSVLNLRASGNGQSYTSNLGNAASAAANGGLTVAVMESNITATLHALATVGKTEVLSRPYILASDNQEAFITVGQEVPIITDSREVELTGDIVNSITYTQVGITLDVTPHINPDGLVILDVSPQVSALDSQTVNIGSATQPSYAPIIDNRSASTRVGIQDGQTIVIGGLMQDQKSVTQTKVPLLGDLPLLGALFRHDNVSKTKTELLIFLTPHVALAPDKLKGMSEDEMKGVKLTPTAIAPGAFKEQMDGMDRGEAAPTTQPASAPAAR